MGMYVGSSSRANVVAFLHGYEYGTRGKCRFTELLSQHIASRYHVQPDALGWPHQIACLADRQSLDWIDVYHVVSSEILSAGLKNPPRRAANPVAERISRRKRRGTS